jgi:hypothetical protein
LNIALKKVPQGTHVGAHTKDTSAWMGLKKKSGALLPGHHTVIPLAQEPANQIPQQFLAVVEPPKPSRLDAIFGGATEPEADEKYALLKESVAQVQEKLLEKKHQHQHYASPAAMGAAEAHAFGVSELLASAVEKASNAAVQRGGIIGALDSVTAGLSQLQELKLSPEILRGRGSDAGDPSVVVANWAANWAADVPAKERAEEAKAAAKAKGFDLDAAEEKDIALIRALAVATAKAEALANVAEALGEAAARATGADKTAKAKEAATALAAANAATKEKVAAYTAAANVSGAFVEPVVLDAVVANDRASAASAVSRATHADADAYQVAEEAKAAARAKGFDLDTAKEADIALIRNLAAATAKAESLAADAETEDPFLSGEEVAAKLAAARAASREKVAAYTAAANANAAFVEPAVLDAVVAHKAIAPIAACRAAVATALAAAEAAKTDAAAKAAAVETAPNWTKAAFRAAAATAAEAVTVANANAATATAALAKAEAAHAAAVANSKLAKADAAKAAAATATQEADLARSILVDAMAVAREKSIDIQDVAAKMHAVATTTAEAEALVAAAEAASRSGATPAEMATAIADSNAAIARNDQAKTAVENLGQEAVDIVTAIQRAEASYTAADTARLVAVNRATAAADAAKAAVGNAGDAATAAVLATAAAAVAIAKVTEGNEAETAARKAVAEATAARADVYGKAAAAGHAAADASAAVAAAAAMDQAISILNAADAAAQAARSNGIDIDDAVAKIHAVAILHDRTEAIVTAGEAALRNGATPGDETMAQFAVEGNAAVAELEAAEEAVRNLQTTDRAAFDAATAMDAAIDAAKAAVSNIGDTAAAATVTSVINSCCLEPTNLNAGLAGRISTVIAGHRELVVKNAEKTAHAADAARTKATAAVANADAVLASAADDAKAAVVADKAAKAQALKTAWNMAFSLSESYTGAQMLRKLAGYPETGDANVDAYYADMLRVYLGAANRFAEENPDDDGTPMSLDPASIYAKLGEIPPEKRTFAAKALLAVQGHLAAADILNHPDRKEKFDRHEIEVSHQWAIAMVRSGRFVDAERDSDGKLIAPPAPATPAIAPSPGKPHKLQKKRPPVEFEDLTNAYELERLAENMATDAEKSLSKSKDEVLAFRVLSRLAKRRVEGTSFGAQEYSGVAQVRAFRDQMLGTLVGQIDLTLQKQFEVEHDDEGNIVRLAPKSGSVLDETTVRLLARRELTLALAHKEWMFNSAEGVPLYGPDKEAALARVELAVLGAYGIRADDEEGKKELNLSATIKQIFDDQNEWKDAPASQKPGVGRSLVPEQFVQWAGEMGAPRDWLTKPIDLNEPPPAPGSLEEMWASLRVAYHATRYGNPNPVVSQELDREPPDRDDMRLVLREGMGEVMRARYPNDPERVEREAIEGIKAGDRQLMEGTGRFTKMKANVTGQLLKKMSRQKDDVDYKEKVSWVKKIGVDIHYQGHRLIDGNIGNEQTGIGPDAVKATFAALRLDWPKTSLTKKALHIRHLDLRADAVQRAIENAAKQCTQTRFDHYRTLIEEELRPAEGVRIPGDRQRQIVRELVRGMPPEVADDVDVMSDLVFAAMNRDMAGQVATGVIANLYPTDPRPPEAAEAVHVLEKLIHTRLQGITGTQMWKQLDGYDRSQIMGAALAAATSGRKEDAVAAMTAMRPRHMMAHRQNMPEQLRKAVDGAFEVALKKGRKTAVKDLFYKNIARNELGGFFQLRSERLRGAGLDAFTESISVPIAAVAEATGLAHFFSGSVTVRPGLGFRSNRGVVTSIRKSAVGDEFQWGESKTKGEQYGAGVGFTGAVGIPAVHLTAGGSVDTVFYSKDARVTKGLVFRGERHGLGNDPAGAKQMAHAYTQLAFPELDKDKDRRMDDADKESSNKRVLQDNPFLSAGQYQHVEVNRQGSVGAGGSVGAKVATVSAKILQVSRMLTGIRVEEQHDDRSGSIRVQRRVVTKTARRETLMATGALSVGLGDMDTKYGVSDSVLAGKSFGSSSRKLEVTERRHLLWENGRLMTNSFVGQASNHIEGLLDIALQHKPMPYEILVQFHHHQGKTLPAYDKPHAALSAADLRAKEDYEELFDEKNDPTDPKELKKRQDRREEVLAATRRHFAEFVSRMDLKNANQQLTLCSDITPEAAEKVTMLTSLMERETDPARKEKWQEEIDKVLENADSWAPINFVLNLLESRKEKRTGLLGWGAGLLGIVRSSQDTRTTSTIADAM